MPVVLKGPRDKEVKMNKGITLIDAPKSSKALSNELFPMVQRIVNVLGSLHFLGILTPYLAIKVETLLLLTF